MSIPVEAPKTFKDKMKALEAAADECEKEFGAGTIRRYGDKNVKPIEVIPTGIISLDYGALQVGGLPRGRVTEIFGPEMSGKTTVALQVIAEAQKAGGTAAFIDAEHALDVKLAKSIGVKMDDILLSQPDYGEQALSVAEKLLETNAIDIIVVDSVAALVPKAELDGEMEDQNIGLHARLMSKALRKLTGKVRKANTVFIFINQIREKIGVMYGNPEVTTGGRALRFYSSVRIECRKIGKPIEEGGIAVGGRAKFKIVKNKCAAPFRETEVTNIFGHGFDPASSLVEMATALSVIEKSGAWYSFKGERIGQGAENAAATLREECDLYDPIYAATKELIVKRNAQ